MMKLIPLMLLSVLNAGPAQGALKPEKIFLAENRPKKMFIEDGLVTGGDRGIDSVILKDIRRAPNKGFERWVIDLEGFQNGESVAIPRPPYYQVAVNPEEKRLIFTIYGNPRFNFNSKKVQAAFKKSPLVSSLELFPKLEEQSWTFSVNLKKGVPVEVFELSNPVRIIVDLKTGK